DERDVDRVEGDRPHQHLEHQARHMLVAPEEGRRAARRCARKRVEGAVVEKANRRSALRKLERAASDEADEDSRLPAVDDPGPEDEYGRERDVAGWAVLD